MRRQAVALGAIADLVVVLQADRRSARPPDRRSAVPRGRPKYSRRLALVRESLGQRARQAAAGGRNRRSSRRFSPVRRRVDGVMEVVGPRPRRARARPAAGGSTMRRSLSCDSAMMCTGRPSAPASSRAASASSVRMWHAARGRRSRGSASRRRPSMWNSRTHYARVLDEVPAHALAVRAVEVDRACPRASGSDR